MENQTTQKSEVQSPVVAPLPETKSKIWLWILGGVLLLGVGIATGTFLGKQLYSIPQPQLVPTPSPSVTSVQEGDLMANWKTYTNTEFKFSFKYPDSYFKYLKDYPNIGVYLAPSDGVGEAKGSPMGLTKEDVWIDATTQSGANIDSLEQFFNIKGQGTEFELLYVQSPKEKIIISNQSGYKIKQYQQNGPQGISSLRVVFLRNNTLYYLVMSAYDKSILQKDEKLFDQILSTFKFTSN